MDAALVILDGWGLGSGERDAVAAARTPNFDRIQDEGAVGTLETHGRAVGLPEGQMGNSEVGHLTIGAGRIVQQSSTRISDAIDDGTVVENEALLSAIEYAATHDGHVHFMGLVSDGGVHSAQSHLHALIECVAEHGVPAVTHAFTDGRDTPPKSGSTYLRELQAVTDDVGTGHVATVSGRYYAMDRDENWERTKRAYDAIVHREAEYTAPSAVESVERAYERGETDEYIEPTLVEREDTQLTDDDAVVFFNFRADRARQLIRLLADIRPDWLFETNPPTAHVVTMTEYDATFDLPVAFPPNEPHDTLGERVAASSRTQLRIAESEKYAHVTYFLNGGREVEFEGEIRTIVDSPDVPTYDQQPEMSALEVTDAAIEVIERDDPSLLVLNYANPDMVGHTGDYAAAIEAVEAVDEQLERLVEACHTAGAHVFLTADHGNADDMGTVDDPHTAHTLNPVPFVSSPVESDSNHAVRDNGTLADIAPTILTVMGIETPDAMTGESLLR
ncbi:2,3-bisphosphoglycerate-independent phosphoglycerate mutase [Halocatena marina]|uniref:2,3-bisphosphoglycerate-independent phosphoglycerate mutase n=1 Tax=Halocatena marina TaxID=2934937 RepID=UPI00222409F8|nr:2,3-bisphosphoglycerate-independent phosphoglycerate mutase [Halocatena marina]